MGCLGGAGWLTGMFKTESQFLRHALSGIVIGSFATVAMLKLALVCFPFAASKPLGAVEVRGLAVGLQRAGLAGPVAGGGPGGLYLSYFLGQPWLGDQPDTSADVAWIKDHARIVLAAPGDSLDRQLSGDPGLRDVTDAVLDSTKGTKRWTINVYQVAER